MFCSVLFRFVLLCVKDRSQDAHTQQAPPLSYASAHHGDALIYLVSEGAEAQKNTNSPRSHPCQELESQGLKAQSAESELR